MGNGACIPGLVLDAVGANSVRRKVRGSNLAQPVIPFWSASFQAHGQISLIDSCRGAFRGLELTTLYVPALKSTGLLDLSSPRGPAKAGELMKTKQRVTPVSVYRQIRKEMPKPTQAFRSKVVFKSSGRKAWKRELD